MVDPRNVRRLRSDPARELPPAAAHNLEEVCLGRSIAKLGVPLATIPVSEALISLLNLSK